MSDWFSDLWPAYACLLATWVTLLFVVGWYRRSLIWLTSNSSRSQDDHELISIVLPARNEAHHLATCLESLRNQSYLRWEAIVIDDRSTDETADIVRRFAQVDPRFQLIQIDALPSNWAGKNHAIHCGVPAANGEWLLFIDADTQHHPDNLSIVRQFAREQSADFVTLLPRQICTSLAERIVHPLACIVLGIFCDLMRTNSSSRASTAFGNGQYMLVRRSAYLNVGGHEAVCSELQEDIQLARRFKLAGFTTRTVVTSDLSQTRMFGSLVELFHGWSRILYGAAGKRAWRILLLLVGMALLGGSAYVVTLVSAWSCWFDPQNSTAWSWLCWSLFHHLMMMIVTIPLYRLTGNQIRYLVFYIPACAVVGAILLQAIRLCFTHRITWRETSYSPDLFQRTSAS